MKSLARWAVAGCLVVAACSPDGTAPEDPQAALALGVTLGADVQMAPDAGTIRVEGPTNRTVSIQPGQTVTIEGLLPGNYTVALEGLRTGQLESFGETTVTVVAGENRQANITLRSFIPASVTAPPQTDAGAAFNVQWTAVQGATGYVLEYADNPAFTGAQTVNATGTTASVTINTPGNYVFRARARNRFSTLSHASGTSAATQVVTPLSPPELTAYTVRLTSGIGCAVGFRDIQTIETVQYTDADGNFPTGSPLTEGQNANIESQFRLAGQFDFQPFFANKPWARGTGDSGSAGTLSSGACWRLPDTNPAFIEHRVRVRDSNGNWSAYATTRVNLPASMTIEPDIGVGLGSGGSQQYTVTLRDFQNNIIEGDVAAFANTNAPGMGTFTQQGLYTLAQGAAGVDNVYIWAGNLWAARGLAGPSPFTNDSWWANCYGFAQSNVEHSFRYYRMMVYQGIGYEFILRGDATTTGDPDLYIRMGAKPTIVTYDAASLDDSYNETIRWTAPATGVLWIGIYGFTNYNNVEFTSHTPVGNCGFPGSGLIPNSPEFGGTAPPGPAPVPESALGPARR